MLHVATESGWVADAHSEPVVSKVKVIGASAKSDRIVFEGEFNSISG
jgi:hypothetical protein